MIAHGFPSFSRECRWDFSSTEQPIVDTSNLTTCTDGRPMFLNECLWPWRLVIVLCKQHDVLLFMCKIKTSMFSHALHFLAMADIHSSRRNPFSSSSTSCWSGQRPGQKKRKKKNHQENAMTGKTEVAGIARLNELLQLMPTGAQWCTCGEGFYGLLSFPIRSSSFSVPFTFFHQ